jgi:hypothetical protein
MRPGLCRAFFICTVLFVSWITKKSDAVPEQADGEALPVDPVPRRGGLSRWQELQETGPLPRMMPDDYEEEGQTNG